MGWLALALLVPVTFQRWSYDAFELPKQYVTLVVTEAALIGALALWLVARPWRGHARWIDRLDAFAAWLRRRPVVAVALAIAVTWLLAAAASFAPEQSWWGTPPRWSGARAQLAYAALFVVSACALTGPAQLSRLAAVTAVAASLSAGYGILQRFGRDPFEWGGYLGATVAADLSRRPPGTFGNPNFLAGYLALSFFITLGALLATSRRWVRVLFGVSLALQLLALVLTQTRGAWLGTIAGAAVFATSFAALYGRGWRRWLAGSTAALLLVLLALRLAQPVLPPGTLLARAADLVSPTEETASIRLTLWRLVGTAWLARPLSGFGPDAIASVFQRAYNAELVAAEGGLGGQSQYDRAENAVIDTLLATGVLGGIAMLAAGVLVARALVRLIVSRDRVDAAPVAAAPTRWQPLVAGTAAALAAHLTAQQFNVEVVGASPLAWLLAGALVGLSTAIHTVEPPLVTTDPQALAPSDAPPPAEPARSTSSPFAVAVVGAVACAVAISLPLAWWELHPLRAGLAYEAGLTLQRNGKPAEAVPHLARANALWPHYYLFWAELAYANRAAARAAPAGPDKQRHYQDALVAVEHALRVNATHPLVWSYWGDIAAEVAVSTNDLTLRNRAKAAHVRATDLAPNWWRYWQSAGDTDMLLGDFPAARERFSRAASLNARNWVLWASLGDAANRGGDKQTARTAYERALSLNPGQPTAATIQRAIESLGPPE